MDSKEEVCESAVGSIIDGNYELNKYASIEKSFGFVRFLRMFDHFRFRRSLSFG